MRLYSEKERPDPDGSGPAAGGRRAPSLREMVILVALKAKRVRVVEVKLHRIAAELEAITGFPPRIVQKTCGGSAVFGTDSWISPHDLVRLLRARLEQECPNGGMFHFSEAREESDSVIAMEAIHVALM
jgi:hypothetical protein